MIRVAEIHWDLLITELWLDIIQHTCDILWLVHFWVQTLKLSRLLVLLVLKSQIGNHQPPSLFEFFMHLPAALWDMRHRPNSDLCKSIYNHKFDRSGRNIRKLCHFLSHINFLCMWVIHTVLSRIDHERSHCDFSQVHHPGLGDWLGELFLWCLRSAAPLTCNRQMMPVNGWWMAELMHPPTPWMDPVTQLMHGDAYWRMRIDTMSALNEHWSWSDLQSCKALPPMSTRSSLWNCNTVFTKSKISPTLSGQRGNPTRSQ